MINRCPQGSGHRENEAEMLGECGAPACCLAGVKETQPWNYSLPEVPVRLLVLWE